MPTSRSKHVVEIDAATQGIESKLRRVGHALRTAVGGAGQAAAWAPPRGRPGRDPETGKFIPEGRFRKGARGAWGAAGRAGAAGGTWARQSIGGIAGAAVSGISSPVTGGIALEGAMTNAVVGGATGLTRGLLNQGGIVGKTLGSLVGVIPDIFNAKFKARSAIATQQFAGARARAQLDLGRAMSAPYGFGLKARVRTSGATPGAGALAHAMGGFGGMTGTPAAKYAAAANAQLRAAAIAVQKGNAPPGYVQQMRLQLQANAPAGVTIGSGGAKATGIVEEVVARRLGLTPTEYHAEAAGIGKAIGYMGHGQSAFGLMKLARGAGISSGALGAYAGLGAVGLGMNAPNPRHMMGLLAGREGLRGNKVELLLGQIVSYVGQMASQGISVDPKMVERWVNAVQKRGVRMGMQTGNITAGLGGLAGKARQQWLAPFQGLGETAVLLQAMSGATSYEDIGRNLEAIGAQGPAGGTEAIRKYFGTGTLGRMATMAAAPAISGYKVGGILGTEAFAIGTGRFPGAPGAPGVGAGGALAASQAKTAAAISSKQATSMINDVTNLQVSFIKLNNEVGKFGDEVKAVIKLLLGIPSIF